MLAPSLLRQFAFVSAYIPHQIENIGDAYKAIAKADIVIENYNFYNQITKEPDTNIKEKHNLRFFQNIKNSAIQYIRESSSSSSAASD